MFGTREPVSDYRQAVWRLAQYYVLGKPADQLDLAVAIVADLFWYSDAKVRHDMGRAVREIDVAPPPRPRFGGVFG